MGNENFRNYYVTIETKCSVQQTDGILGIMDGAGVGDVVGRGCFP